jgi:hypothetical protein
MEVSTMTKKDLELGQMLFGPPVSYDNLVPRESWMSGPFQILLDAINEKTGEKDYGYTPDFSNDFFIIRSYYWGEDEEEMEKPNFEVPSENFSLTWYKYPFRGSYSSEKLTPKRWNDLIQKCIKSLEELN